MRVNRTELDAMNNESEDQERFKRCLPISVSLSERSPAMRKMHSCFM